MLWKRLNRIAFYVAVAATLLTAGALLTKRVLAHDYPVPPYSTWTIWLAETEDGETPAGEWVQVAEVRCPTYEVCYHRITELKATTVAADWVSLKVWYWSTEFGPVITQIVLHGGIIEGSSEEIFAWSGDKKRFAYSELKDGGLFGGSPAIEKIYPLKTTAKGKKRNLPNLVARVRVTFED